MAAISGATELLPEPAAGRTFESNRRVYLGDVDVAGRLRLDATARLLQDVATDDAADAGLGGRFGWVVRRTVIETSTPARLDEALTITTYCTGLGRSWAERTTTMVGHLGAAIHAVSLWVQVDPATARPTALTDQFHQIYGEACGARRVSPRLSLGTPGGDATRTDWVVRRVDLDPFDHVNNAANWAFVEQAASFTVTGRQRCVRAEMEFVAPVEFGRSIELVSEADGSDLGVWLVAAGQVLSAARLTTLDG